MKTEEEINPNHKYYTVYQNVYDYNIQYYKSFLLIITIIISIIFIIMIIKKYN
jgi:hypothetical protein